MAIVELSANIKGAAYRCFCTPEELDAEREEAEKQKRPYRYKGKCRHLSPEQVKQYLTEQRPYTIRFKMPEGVTSWDDIVYGKISVNNNEIDDFIIQRSSGVPVYQLAVVVDDIAMGITHIIRGEDHIPNTPKQINIWRAFGKQEPQFAHLPLLLGTDGKRLSKRHGATGVDEYRSMGFPSVAVFNYLALLGWAPRDGKDILRIEEIVPQFELSAISRKAAVFDPKKLEHISGQHISQMNTDELISQLLPLVIQKRWLPDSPDAKQVEYLSKVVQLMRERIRTFQQFIEWGSYFFKDPIQYDEKAVAKYWRNLATRQQMLQLKERYEQLTEFKAATTEECLRSLAADLQIKAADLIHPLRLALTGFSISPGIFEVIELLGKETVIRRLEIALQQMH